MSFFSQAPVEIEIKFDGEEARQIIDTKDKDKNTHHLAPLYGADETVKGSVIIRPRDGRKVEHTGIKVQFIGAIEFKEDKSQPNEFISWARELAAPGEVRHAETYTFEFKNVEKQFESYNGLSVKLRYFVRVTMFRRMNDIVREKDLWVYQYKPEPEGTAMVRMDVGIEDCMHIECEYSKSNFHLKDVIIGRIYFTLVRLKLKHMELSLIRKESVGVPPNNTSQTETVVRFEIMDGAPVKGETIPIRLFLSGFDLVPTMRDVNKKFSVRTYLSFVLVDDADRRYFKQREIGIYRSSEE